VKRARYTSESSIVKLIMFMKIEEKILSGSCKQNEIQAIVRNVAAMAMLETLSESAIRRAIRNLEKENMMRWAIQGYERGEKEAKVS